MAKQVTCETCSSQWMYILISDVSAVFHLCVCVLYIYCVYLCVCTYLCIKRQV